MSGPVDHDLIRELAALLEETGLTEIQVETADQKLRVSRRGPAATASAVAAPAASPTPAPAESPAESAADHPGTVLSPMVGIAYLAPEPGAKAFVETGGAVSQGQTLLIIEAMKTMNPILAPHDGTVTRILVKNGEPVEYGDALLIIE